MCVARSFVIVPSVIDPDPLFSLPLHRCNIVSHRPPVRGRVRSCVTRYTRLRRGPTSAGNLHKAKDGIFGTIYVIYGLGD